MKYNVYLNIIIVTIIFYGCDHFRKENANKGENDSTYIKEWYYPNGNIEFVQEYSIKDSLEHGVFLHYYSSGQLKDSANKYNDDFHGERFRYYENGNIYQRINYKNGKFVWGLFYRKDGSLEYYRAYNYEGTLRYVVEYDLLGNNIRMSDEPLYNFYYDSVDIGGLIDITLHVAQPPNFNVNVDVIDLDKSINKIAADTTYTPNEYNEVHYYRNHNSKKGNWILHVAILENKYSDEVVLDSFLIKVDKIGNITYTDNIPSLTHFIP